MKKIPINSYIWTLAIAILIALFTRTILITAYKVPTGSMQPTLKPGDFIFASKINYGIVSYKPGWLFRWLKPQRNEVVVLTNPEQSDTKYVKRVIAIEGDEVKIENDEIWLNGNKLQYSEVADQIENPNADVFVIRKEIDQNQERQVINVKSHKTKTYGPIKVPEGHVFLLGDNRGTSEDSRSWGTVPNSQIIAKVQVVWLSLDWQKKWVQNRLPQVRWNRIFSKVN